tara:strand:+ start:3360 stop:3782 length:423 start_codon:yes stop_codon:yes gene_type:complete
VKHALMAKTDKSDLVLLSFTKEEASEELNWKHSKEFEYKGSMYDIVEQETKGDTTYYWCWWDNEETQLNQRLDKLLAMIMGHDKKDKQSNNRLSKFFKSLFWKENSITFSNEIALITHQSPYLFNFREIFYSPPTPPPQT